MSARLGRRLQPGPEHLIAVAALLAATLGGTAIAADAPLGVGLIIGLLYVPLVLVNLPLGLALWTGLTFLQSFSFVSVGPNAASALIGVGWLGTLATRRHEIAAAVVRSRAAAPALLLLAWLSLSAIWARESGLVGSSLRYWYIAVAVGLVVATTVATPAQLRLVLGAFVVGAALSVIIGLAQSGLGSSGTAIDSASVRLQGGAGNANDLAAGLVPAMVLAAALIGQLRDPFVRLALAAAIPLLAVGLAATQSRGGLVAAGVTMVAALALSHHRRAVLALVLTFAIGLAGWYAVTPSALGRVTSFNGGGTGREDLWRVGWRIFQDQPVLGVGLNNFRAESFRYVRRPGQLDRVDLIAERPRVVHNVYLQLLVEAGVVGLVLYMAVVLACLRAGLVAGRRFDRTGRPGMGDLSRSIVIATLGMLAASFFISNGTDDRLWLLLGMGPALLAIAMRSAPSQHASMTA